MRLGSIFAAICMAIVAGSAGAFTYFFIGATASEAVMAGVATLAVLALYNSASARIGLRTAVDPQLADLARAEADLARQVAEIDLRLGALEGAVESALDRTRAVTDPLAVEIAELGATVKQLAETVAPRQTAPASFPDAAAPPRVLSAEAPAGRPQAEPDAHGVERPFLPALAQSVPSPEVERRAGDEVLASIRAGIEANGIDLYLQPIVQLPQRKVRYYEAMARLRMEGGALLQGADFIPHAEFGGLMPKIDGLVIFRSVQVLRRLLLKNRDIGLFCNLSGTSLGRPSFPQFLEFMQANRAIATSLVLEFTQRSLHAMSAVEHEGLAALSELGFGFSLDNVTDLRIEPRELAGLGFRFIKIRADRLLQRMPPLDLPPLDDLPDRFGRLGLDLIAEKIESEGSVIDLLDRDVRYGQGFVFSPPRPVRAETPGETQRNSGAAAQAS